MKNKIYKILLLIVLIFSINIVKATEEKSSGYIPSEYKVYYNIDKSKLNLRKSRGIYSFYSATPSSYDLRDVSGKRLIPPIDNQGQAPFCWAFASNNMIESYYLRHELGEIDLSDNQPAYVAHYYNNENSFYSGNSILSVLEFWHKGHSPVTEDHFGKYTIDYTTKAYADYLDNSNVAMDIRDVIVFPTLRLDYVLTLPVSDIKAIFNDYITPMKQHITNNSALFAGIYWDFYDESKKQVYYDGSTILTEDNLMSGHAITIIGWDDNAMPVTINGNQLTGAWLAMNSWGSKDEYFYISYYDRSVYDAIAGIQNIQEKQWDNSYTESKLISSTSTYRVFEFKKNKDTEIIDSIKILHKSEDNDLTISITDGFNTYNSTTSPEITFGIKTYEFPDISFDSEKIYVKVEFDPTKIPANKELEFNIALFTKEETQVKQLNIKDKTFNDSQPTYTSFDYDILTDNILSGTEYNINVYDDQDNNVTSHFNVKKSILVNGYATLELNIKTKESLEYSSYLTMEVSADGLTNSIKHYNNGVGTKVDPYIIRHPYELILLDQAGYYFQLGNDIDLYEDINSKYGYFYNSNQGWNPVNFKSYLDGKGYAIKNLTTTKGSMFESIDGGVIKNIKLDNYVITDTNNTTNEPAIISKTLKNNSEISNVFINESSVKSSTNSVGGIVGTIYDGKIENIHLKDTNIESKYYTGVITSKMYNPTNSLTIKNVYSYNTTVNGNKKSMIGIIDINTPYENLKPITIINNIINTNDELSLIGLENINITNTNDDVNIVPSQVNKIITEEETSNVEIFNEFNLEEIWSFDKSNSAYLKLFTKDFDNLLKLKTYKLQDDMIYQVKTDTKPTDFITDITNISDLQYKIYSNNGMELSNENNIATGSYIEVSKDEQTKRYYIVVAGDIDGNGTSGAIDAYAIVLHTVAKKILTGQFLLAADYNLDGSVGARDAYAIILNSIK